MEISFRIISSSFHHPYSFFYLVDSKNLHLIACDVGEGDAILAVYGKTQILTDGGLGTKVLECLGKYIPALDKEIELVVLTHPDEDHYQGLIEVFKRYKVDSFLTSKATSDSQGYGLLESLVGGGGTKVIYPKDGMTLRFGRSI